MSADRTPRWFLVAAGLLGVSFAVPAVQALVRGDVRLAVAGLILTGFCWWPVLGWFRSRTSPIDSDPTTAPPEDLRARGGRGWFLPIALLVVVGVLGLAQRPFTSIVPVCALVIAAVMVLQLRGGGDEVDFTAEALVVRFRTGRERRFAWEDVLELSWSSPLVSTTGSGPVARVRGNAFDSPGPTSPTRLAAVLLVGQENRRWGREQVRRAAARHGIPFSDDLIADVNSGRRTARLPGEHS